MVSEMQEAMLKIGLEKHIVTGYPRLDNLVDPDEESRRQWKDFIGNNHYDHAILYAPTWRNGIKPTEFFPFPDFKLHELDNLLEAYKAILLLRPHVNDIIQFPEISEKISKFAKQAENIRLATHTIFPNLYSLLPFISILISSLFKLDRITKSIS